MAPAESTPPLSTPLLSRRNVSKGLAWSVPAVAAVAAAPAFAASPQCYALTWSTTPVAGPSTQQVSSTGARGAAGTITVTASATAPYNFGDGNYGKRTFETYPGGVYMGTWTTGAAAARSTGAQAITVAYPQGATGPISFTISGITATGTTADAYGATTYVDAVQVTNGGGVVNPTTTTGAVTVSGGVVSGTSMTGGSASYTITSPTVIVISLRNTTTAATFGPHPNQTIRISNFVCGSTPPPPVVEPSPTLAYRFRGSIYSRYGISGFSCYNNRYGRYGSTLNYLEVDNQTSLGSSPLGFSIVEMPRTDGSGTSPRTSATLQSPVQLVVAYPAGMVNTSAANRGFAFSNGTSANWSVPTVRQTTLTDPSGVTQTYDVFTFTWLGALTQSTVADQTATGTRPVSWSGTALTGTWAVNTSFCAVESRMYYFSNYYAGGTAASLGSADGSFGSFTTGNGFTGLVRSNNTTTGGWVILNQ